MLPPLTGLFSKLEYKNTGVGAANERVNKTGTKLLSTL